MKMQGIVEKLPKCNISRKPEDVTVCCWVEAHTMITQSNHDDTYNAATASPWYKVHIPVFLNLISSQRTDPPVFYVKASYLEGQTSHVRPTQIPEFEPIQKKGGKKASYLMYLPMFFSHRKPFVITGLDPSLISMGTCPCPHNFH